MLKEHFLKLSKLKKRVFAGAMATALISTSINIGTFVVEAGSSKNGSVITAYESLPEEIAYQYLPIGSEEFDIEFPDELNVTIYSNEDTEETEEENEGAFEERTTRREDGDESDDEEENEETRETPESEEGEETRSGDNESDNGDSENRDTGDSEPVNEGSQGGDENNNNNNSEDVQENNSNNEEDAAQPNEGGENSENNNNESNDNGTDTDTDTAVNNTVDTTTAPETAPEGGEPEGISSIAEAASTLFGPVTVYAAEPEDDDDNDDGEDNNDANADDENGNDEDNDDNGLRELSQGEARTLKNVTWTLIKDESTYSRFQAVRAGDVFVYEPLIKQFGLKSDVELPKIRVTITEEDGSYEEREEATEEATEEETEEAEETVSENEAEEEEETVSENEAEETEETVSENEAEEESVSENEAEPEVFDQMMIVGGVRVRVEAPEGVFPAGSTLKVVRLGDSDEETAKRVISSADTNAAGNTDAENTENTGSTDNLDIILFDVTILDKDGNEIQPDTGFGVPRITFENAEIIDKSVDDGNANEDSGLAVYHFDDGFSGVEKLDTEVNKGEKSVSAPAEHFSPLAVVAAAGYENTRRAQDYLIDYSGMTVEYYLNNLDDNNDSSCRIRLSNVTSNAKMKIYMVDGVQTSNLRFKIYSDENPTGTIYIELNGVNLTNNYSQNTNFSDYNDLVYFDVNNAEIKLINTTLSSTTHGLTIRGSKKIIIGEGTSTIYTHNESSGGESVTLTSGATLNIQSESGKDERNCKLNIRNINTANTIFNNYGDVNISSGTLELNTGFASAVAITGGFVTMLQNSTFTGSDLQISGGTHRFHSNFIPATADYVKITGGSVFTSHSGVASGSKTLSGDPYKLFVFDLTSSNANKKVTKLFGSDGGSLNYGMNDLYTDQDGKAYIWLPDGVSMYGVEADGKWFVLSSSTGTNLTALTPYASSCTINRLVSSLDISRYITIKYDGSVTPAEWYPGKVTITARDFLVSDSQNGTFGESYNWTGNGKNVSKTLYFKYIGDTSKVYYGAVVSKTVGPVNFSTGKPTGTIKVLNKSSSKIQTKAKTVGYTNDSKKKVTITANKNSTVAGVKKIEYYFTDKFYGDENTIAKSMSGNEAEYNEGSKPGLVENKLNYCYAKITDNAGNAGYISTQGVWYDTKEPKAKSAKATPEDTKATVEIKGEDKESGIANYYVLAKKKTDSKPTKENVKSSGKKSDNGNVEVTGLTANTAYKFYCVIEDKCENLSDIKECSTTTKETKKEDAAAGAAAGQGGAAGAGGAGAGAGSDKLGESNSKKHGVGAGSDKDDKEEKEETEIKSRIPYIEDATEGIQIGKENTSGWDKIEEETGKAEAPAEIHIDMNGSSVVPATALNSIKGRDITCFYEMGDDVIWAVNGMSIGDKVPDDIDFKVKTDTKNIPSKLVNEVADVYPHKNISIAYDGEFGFTAIMCLNVGEENAGMYANRYYYNEEEGSLEFIDSEDVDGNGNTEFEFTHASDYTIVIRGDALTEKSAAALVNTSDDGSDLVVSEAADPPKKSNNHWWLLLITILSLILCGVILFMPDKKRQQG